MSAKLFGNLRLKYTYSVLTPIERNIPISSGINVEGDDESMHVLEYV